MPILKNSVAVFWSKPGWKNQFHGDFFPHPHETMRETVARYRAMFPADIIRSIRGPNGRFLSFKG